MSWYWPFIDRLPPRCPLLQAEKITAQLPQGAIVNKDDLITFYAEQDPSKVADVDAILAAYSTQDLVLNLIKKYGHAPAAMVVQRSSKGSMIKGWAAT